MVPDDARIAISPKTIKWGETGMKKRDIRSARLLLSLLIISIPILAACGEQKNSAASEAPAETDPSAPQLVPVTQVVNWFPQPEHGGFYAAAEKGYYRESGLDMTIMPGGPQVSTTQIVASGKAQFGLTTADDLLLARENGIPLVAIAATFQKNPQGIMVHKGQSINTLADLEGHKVYVRGGSGYWEYLKKKFNFKNVQELSYNGSLTGFVSDPSAGIQCYITSEPFDMKQQNVDVEVLLNADAGYNPYANVMFTTEKYLKEHPEIVKAYVEASLKGWSYYKDHYQEINPIIQQKNPDFTLDKMNYTAQTMMSFVFGEDAATHGVGYMSKERWETLGKQLTEIGLLKSAPDVSKAYTTEFLPNKQ